MDSQYVYVNLDNAASTPSFAGGAKTAWIDFLEYYSSVHRGMGFKSQVSTHAYEAAREAVMDFTGADPRAGCLPVWQEHNRGDQ